LSSHNDFDFVAIILRATLLIGLNDLYLLKDFEKTGYMIFYRWIYFHLKVLLTVIHYNGHFT